VIPLVVFAVFLTATLCIHVIGYGLRSKSVWSKILLYLGFIIVVCMGWQFYNTQQNVTELRTALSANETEAKTAKATAAELQQQEHMDVSRLNGLGVPGLVGNGLKETSALNDILSPYCRVDMAGSLSCDCTPAAMKAYDEAIKLESKFPFSYHYQGSCAKANNTGDWQRDFETERRILLITTKIPGHNGSQDNLLKALDAENFGSGIR
jgi:hypothetical protein